MQDITCKQLQDLLQASDPVVLVDVRTPDEQQVSVLPGNVMRKEDFDGHQQEWANHTIVTYWYDQCASAHFCLAVAAQLRIINSTSQQLSSAIRADRVNMATALLVLQHYRRQKWQVCPATH